MIFTTWSPKHVLDSTEFENQVGWATGLSLPTNLFSRHKGGGQSKPVVHTTWLRCEAWSPKPVLDSTEFESDTQT